MLSNWKMFPNLAKSMFCALHHKKICNHGVGKYVRGVVPTMPPRKTMCSLSYRHHAHNACSHTRFFVCVWASVYLCSYRSRPGSRVPGRRPPGRQLHATRHTPPATWLPKHTFGVQRAPAPMRGGLLTKTRHLIGFREFGRAIKRDSVNR